MKWPYAICELIASFLESGVAICAVTRITGGCCSKKDNRVLICLYALFCTVVITILNSISIFSFFTMCIAIILAGFSTKFLSRGSLLLGCTASVLGYLFTLSIDYIWLFLFCMLTESPVTDTISFQALLNPSPLRCLYLFIDKSSDILLLIVLWRFLPKLQKISLKQTVFILSLGLSVFAVLSALIALIMGQSILAMQNAIMFSCIFSCLCVFAVIALLIINGNYQEEKQKAELLRITNQLIAQNYQELYANRKEIARRIHDFNHHIKALEVLASQEHADKTIQYTRSILKSSYKEKNFCKSGNNIIDAVINCKAAEAEALSIHFRYSVELSQPIEIDPVDVCAILSNQIDNAFEASRQVPDISKRDVRVKIWIKNNSTLFFRVENYVDTNPLISNPGLRTTKVQPKELHGFGLQNIYDTAAKYGGALRNSCQEQYFVSTVFVCLNSF